MQCDVEAYAWSTCLNQRQILLRWIQKQVLYLAPMVTMSYLVQQELPDRVLQELEGLQGFGILFTEAASWISMWLQNFLLRCTSQVLRKGTSIFVKKLHLGTAYMLRNYLEPHSSNSCCLFKQIVQGLPEIVYVHAWCRSSRTTQNAIPT